MVGNTHFYLSSIIKYYIYIVDKKTSFIANYLKKIKPVKEIGYWSIIKIVFLFLYKWIHIKHYFILDLPVPSFLKHPLPMYVIAEQYWDLKAYPTQYVFSLLALISDDRLEKDKCLELSSAEGQEEWLSYCRRPKRTILEVRASYL